MDLVATRTAATSKEEPGGFVRALGLFDSTMIVAGSMIGSGIFIVSADIARQVGSSGWLLVAWVITGLLTVAAALSYGELAGMMPKAGGQYVYLRETYSPLFGFLYGWAFFLVIQSGTIAAVGVAFAKYLGVLVPWVSPDDYIVQPIMLSSGYAISLSRQQLVGIAMIVALTAINTRGIHLGKWIQNAFTSVKTLSLVALILLGVFVTSSSEVVRANFADLWTPKNVASIESQFASTTSAAAGALGMIVALCVAQVGSLFSSDAWNNITFTAAEVKNPKRTIPLSLAVGTGLVIVLYVLANVAYLCTLPLDQIQHAPQDRVGTAMLAVKFGAAGATIMAIAIVISTFGCNNGLILSGARVSYAMSQDGLFFKSTGKLNARRVPAVALALQCVWSCLLVLPRTRTGNPADPYGNLYSNLLDYVVFSVLIFYVLTIAGLFVLRRKRPDAERPYRAFGYPIVPALYVVAATVIMIVLLVYKTQTTWPGLVIVLTGIPVYFVWHRRRNERPA